MTDRIDFIQCVSISFIVSNVAYPVMRSLGRFVMGFIVHNEDGSIVGHYCIYFLIA